MYNIFSPRTKKLVSIKKRLIVGYLLAGYKDSKSFFDSLKVCYQGNIDILEIGFPSSNPYADGKTIASAHTCVDRDIATNIDYWKKIRNDTDKPIWIMAYYDDFIQNGTYMQFAKENLFDGIVIPDTSLELQLELMKELKDYHVDVIGFANPAMTGNSLEHILKHFTLIYAQLYVGQTGMSPKYEMHHEMLFKIKEFPKVLSFAGFGINSYEKVKKVLDEGFFGAIVGTEFINRINISNQELKYFIDEISKAV